MPNALIPQSFWFRTALRCPRVDGIPILAANKPLLDLPDSCLLPDFGAFDGKAAWAEVRVAWNPGGLAIQVDSSGKVGRYVRDEDLPEASDGVHVWIDTRDARDIHRATKFCHRFSATLESQPRGSIDVRVEPRKIHRALADPTGTRPSAIKAQAVAKADGARVMLFFPSESLHGFDPDTNRRLGFTYQITDPGRAAHWLALGSEFPVGEDPSLWATLELV